MNSITILRRTPSALIKLSLTILLVLVVVAATFNGYRIIQNRSQSQNIVGTWKLNNDSVISFSSNGTLSINQNLENTNLIAGDASYSIPSPNVVRISQGNGIDDYSIEFDMEITNTHLTLYLMGEKYLELEKVGNNSMTTNNITDIGWVNF